MRRYILANLEMIILKLLQLRQKLCGYEILREIYDHFGIWLSTGTLYPVLNKLELKGSIKATGKTTKGEAKFYQITSNGMVHLSSLISENNLYLKLLKKILSEKSMMMGEFSKRVGKQAGS